MVYAEPIQLQEVLRTRRRASFSIVAVCGLTGSMLITLAVPDWHVWSTPFLLVVPLLLALAVMRLSIISSAYLAQIVIYFGLTSLILGSHWPPRLIANVLMWSLGLATGAVASAVPSPTTTSRARVWQTIKWPHYTLAICLMGISAYLTLSGGSGYGAQLLSGVSTPTGVLGTLSVASPIVTLLLLFSCLGAEHGLAGQ